MSRQFRRRSREVRERVTAEPVPGTETVTRREMETVTRREMEVLQEVTVRWEAEALPEVEASGAAVRARGLSGDPVEVPAAVLPSRACAMSAGSRRVRRRKPLHSAGARCPERRDILYISEIIQRKSG